MRIEEVRSGLCAQLRSRREEIERSVLTRVHAIDPRETSDPEYMRGLRAAVGAAVGYGIEALERSEDRAPPIPTALLSQARLAVRNRIGIDTVLRRYFAGYTLLGDFVIEEAARAGISSGPAQKRLLRLQATLFDRLIEEVSGEYAREVKSRPSSAEQRRAERVKRLLDGELLDPAEIPYDFDAWHLGLLATGPGAAEAVGELAKALDHRLLLARPDTDTAWAWFGGRHRPDPEAIHAAGAALCSARLAIAFGEPGKGMVGWRVSHRQAAAVIAVAQSGAEPCVRYVDAALPASILQDDLLFESLHRLYLSPLEVERDRGETWRRTLRAYFAAQSNISSTAAALGVTRKTVKARLGAIEKALGRPLEACAIDLTLALRVSEMREARGETIQSG